MIICQAETSDISKIKISKLVSKPIKKCLFLLEWALLGFIANKGIGRVLFFYFHIRL